MAYLPVSGLTPIYSPYPNYWLKFYQAGTTTPLAMATDSAAQTTLAKAQINAQGLPITAGNVIFTPHVNVNYDAYLFPTALEADNNTTINAIRIADNLSPIRAESVDFGNRKVTISESGPIGIPSDGEEWIQIGIVNVGITNQEPPQA